MTLMTGSLESQVDLSPTHTTTQDSRDHLSSNHKTSTFMTSWSKGDTQGIPMGDNNNQGVMGALTECNKG